MKPGTFTQMYLILPFLRQLTYKVKLDFFSGHAKLNISTSDSFCK